MIVVTVSIAIPIAIPVAFPGPAIVVVPTARPFTPFPRATIDNLEVGAAAAVHPNAVARVSPSAIEHAIGFTALADDKNAV